MENTSKACPSSSSGEYNLDRFVVSPCWLIIQKQGKRKEKGRNIYSIYHYINLEIPSKFGIIIQCWPCHAPPAEMCYLDTDTPSSNTGSTGWPPPISCIWLLSASLDAIANLAPRACRFCGALVSLLCLLLVRLKIHHAPTRINTAGATAPTATPAIAPLPRGLDGWLLLPLPIIVVAVAVAVAVPVRDTELPYMPLAVPLLLLVVRDVIELDVVQVDSTLVTPKAVIWPEARVEPYGEQPTPTFDMVTPNVPESQHHEALRDPLPLLQRDQLGSGHYMRKRVSTHLTT
jgi:hypothetical protein